MPGGRPMALEYAPRELPKLFLPKCNVFLSDYQFLFPEYRLYSWTSLCSLVEYQVFLPGYQCFPPAYQFAFLNINTHSPRPGPGGRPLALDYAFEKLPKLKLFLPRCKCVLLVFGSHRKCIWRPPKVFWRSPKLLVIIILAYKGSEWWEQKQQRHRSDVQADVAAGVHPLDAGHSRRVSVLFWI